jgi:exodeoxyribonuclease V beta subunit
MADHTHEHPHTVHLTDPAQVDLTRHTVIEASAGTGKTYTIERLFIRLLTEPPALPIEKILVVTFTEKATGEMKDRIRKAIEKQLADLDADDEHRPLMTVALQSFDNAQISTIHGFCHRMLREYAFENGQQFEYDIAADHDLYERLLYRQLRGLSQHSYGTSKPLAVLASAGFPGADRNAGSGWMKKVIDIARRWNPAAGELLNPGDPGSGPLDVCLARYQVAILERLSAVCGPVDAADPETNAFYQAYGSLSPNIVRTRQGEIVIHVIKLLRDAADWLAQRTAETSPDAVIDRVAECFERCSETGQFGRKGFNCLMPDNKQWDKAGNNMVEVCPQLENVIEILQELRCANQSGPGLMFTVKAIVALQRDVVAYKEEHGLLSYDDMINMLADAVGGDASETSSTMLVTALRNRFAVALVDEFQDTDMRQWAIFKRVFVDAPAAISAAAIVGDPADDEPKPSHRLIVVGDPKQAIYGFRGADLKAYFEAQRQLMELGSSQTVMYALTTNWRSMPDLIDGFNAVFRDQRWFPKSDQIDYLQAKAPPPETRRSRLYVDNTDSTALTAAVPDDITGVGAARQAWYRWIGNEIKRLLEIDPGPALQFGELGEAPRSLRANDICVLTRSGPEAAKIEKNLTELEVPCTIYKKPGIYKSIEALELACLLSTVADPTDASAFRKMLLTSFFGIPLAELAKFEGLPPTHPIKTLLTRWNIYAANRQWSALFRSALVDTGIRLRDLQNPDRERRLTNLEQIVQHLQNEAARQSLDIVGIRTLLDNLRGGSVAVADEEDLHRRETERRKVQIMTIHKSKGLEFPVVFLAGGITAGAPSGDYYPVRRDGRIVYDLTKTARRQLDDEQQAENRRLFYVALTRARLKLYVLQLPPASRELGPTATIVGRALAEAESELADIAPVIDELACTTAETATAVDEQLIVIAPPDLPPTDLPLWNWSRSLAIESYSNLKVRLGGTPDGNDHADAPDLPVSPIEFDEESSHSPADDEPPGDTERTAPGVSATNDALPMTGGLPPGTRTGNLLHSIFESISFLDVGTATDPAALLTGDTAAVIDVWMGRYRLPPTSKPGPGSAAAVDYRAEVARLVWTALHMSLPNGGRLCDLGSGDRKHELEFYFPYPHLDLPEIPGTNRRDGYIKGFVDLIYRWQDMYYILDWKSDSLPSYTPAHLQAHMAGHGYDFQYQLYTIAVQRWLAESAIGDQLGGVIYLFLRGLEPGSPNGIYHQQFADGVPPVSKYMARLNAVLQDTHDNDETPESAHEP